MLALAGLLGLVSMVMAGADVSLEATLADDEASITGLIRWQADNQSRQLATYPRLLNTATALGEVEVPWTYPGGFSAASMALGSSAEDLRAGPGTAGADTPPGQAWTPIPAASNDPQVQHFRTQIPKRLGAFGRHREVLSLLAGWHPVPGDGRQLRPRRISYKICVPAGRSGLVGSQPVTATGPRCLHGSHWGRYVPILLAPRLRVATTPHGVLVAPVEAAPRRSHDAALPRLQPAGQGGDGRAWSRLQAVLAAAAQRAAAAGLPPRPLLLVVGPLRAHLSEPFDDGLLISDRALQPSPFAVGAILTALQSEGLERAIWQRYAWPRAAQREPQLAPDVVAEAVAEALWQDARAAAADAPAADDAAQMLDRVAIIPDIDNLVFAPQTPFVTTYYAAPMLPRPGAGPWPEAYAQGLSGRLLYHKVRDLLGTASAASAARRYLQGGADWQTAMAAAPQPGAREIVTALAPWLGPLAPQVDYGVQLLPTAATGIDLLVTAAGPAASKLQEPIEVAVVDAEGTTHQLRRRGPGPLHLQAPGPPALLQLDPRRRLAEDHHPPGQQAGFNNRVPRRWRLLINDITSLLSLTNQQLSLTADLSLRRLYETRRRFNLALALVPGSVGANLGVSHAFGRELNALRLSQGVSLAVGLARLLEERHVGHAGWIGTLSANYLYDTRLSHVSSFRGSGLAAGITWGGGKLGGRAFQFTQAGLSGLWLWPLDLDLALLLRLRADWSSDQTPPQYALRLGGRYRGGRGYESDAARGRRRGLASAELRHTLAGAGRIDLAGLVTLTRVEGALFADAIYLPHNGSCRPDTYFDVGYGLRFLADLMQMAPTVLAIDLGIPLTRCTADPTRLPFALYVAFLQSFSSF